MNLNNKYFWAIVLVAGTWACGGCKPKPQQACLPSPSQVLLPDGQALADALGSGLVRITEHVMASEGGYNKHYVGGIFTHSTTTSMNYYLVGSPVGGTPDIALLGDRVKVNLFWEEAGYLLAHYTTRDGRQLVTGVGFNNIQADYPGTDGRENYLEAEKNATDERPVSSGKYAVGGFTAEQEATIEAFLPRLKKLLKNNDRAAIADMIDFPLGVSLDGDLSYVIRDAATFVKLFPRVFHPGIMRQIRAAQDENIFCNWQGVSLASGLIWICPSKGPEVKISQLVDQEPRR